MNYVYGPGREYTCVVYGDAHSSESVDSVPFTIEAYYDDENRHIADGDRRAVLEVFERCCTLEFGSCLQWTTALRSDPARWSDFCHIPPSRCDASGRLVELDMRGFDLRCGAALPAGPLSRLSALEKLHLSQNPRLVNGSDADSLAGLAMLADSLPALTHLDAARTGVAGSLSAASTGPYVCSMASRMLSINLNSNAIAGAIPACLLQSATLRDLSLAQNALSGELPLPRPDSPLEHLLLGFNEIGGEIPPGFFGAGLHIKVLDLRANRLGGEIPADIGSAPAALTRINLSANGFSGALPDSLATDAVNLDFIDVSGNAITSLPDVPWRSETIYAFVASDNLIEGGFPDLSSSADLTFLLIHNNFLSGSLPPVEGGSYQFLRVMNISNNAFSGELSSGWIENTRIFAGDLDDRLAHVLDLSFNNFTAADVAFFGAATRSMDGGSAGELVLSGNPLCSSDIPMGDAAGLMCAPLCGAAAGDEAACVDPGAAMQFFEDAGAGSEGSGGGSEGGGGGRGGNG